MSRRPGRPRPQPAQTPEHHERGRQLERLILFSDAVFAIAITLLIIDVRVPDTAGEPGGPGPMDVLQDVIPKILSYAISFLVIGAYWIGHHRIFSLVRRQNQRLLWLNLLFLMSVAFIPFPTSFLNTFNDDPAGPIVYAVAQSLVGFSEAALWIYLRRSDLLVPGLDPRYLAYTQWRFLRVPVAFLLSIPLAFVEPELAIYGGAGLIFVASLLIGWRFGDAAALHPESEFD